MYLRNCLSATLNHGYLLTSDTFALRYISGMGDPFSKCALIRIQNDLPGNKIISDVLSGMLYYAIASQSVQNFFNVRGSYSGI
jgi:hypothetical protein